MVLTGGGGGGYMDLISLLPTIFQLSPFSLGSFCLPSNGAVGGGYCAKGTICNDPNSSWGSGFYFKVLKTALKFVWPFAYFSPNYKSIQIQIE